MSDNLDTIVAISTPAGCAHRGIVRVSGKRAFAIAAKIFKPFIKNSEKICNFTALHGRIKTKLSGDILAFLFVYNTPTSYTGEDVIELHTFGSPALLDSILYSIISAGARLAQPGEFTKRAFLSGRIDLSQAESVATLIGAQNESEIRSAKFVLSGGLSEKVRASAHLIRDALALLEPSIDFTDQEIDYVSSEEIASLLQKSAKILRTFTLKTSSSCSYTRVVICGAPNVGKSSLFNLLVGKKRALTSPIAGTTRDAILEDVKIDGAHFTLIDCAGDRDSYLAVEKFSAEQMKKFVHSANIAIFVSDFSAGVSAREKNFFNQIQCKKIFVLNKVDLKKHTRIPHLPKDGLVRTSCITGEGIDELKSLLVSLVKNGRVECSPSAIAVTARQQGIIQSAIRLVTDAQKKLSKGNYEEVVALDLRDALSLLSEITGESVTESVLDAIFSRFCIGK